MAEPSFVNLDHLETILDLDRRHEELLAELDCLDQQVSTVLREVRLMLQPDAQQPVAQEPMAPA